jgi:hypothetical protein
LGLRLRSLWLSCRGGARRGGCCVVCCVNSWEYTSGAWRVGQCLLMTSKVPADGVVFRRKDGHALEESGMLKMHVWLRVDEVGLRGRMMVLHILSFYTFCILCAIQLKS